MYIFRIIFKIIVFTITIIINIQLVVISNFQDII